MIIVAQNQKQTITGGLAKLLKLKICAKVMLTVNVEIVRFVRFLCEILLLKSRIIVVLSNT